MYLGVLLAAVSCVASQIPIRTFDYEELGHLGTYMETGLVESLCSS